MSSKDLVKKYEEHAHAMQTAIAYNPDKRAQEPKHLRVGIDLRKAEHAGLVNLLIAKGVFTQEEYLEAIVVSTEVEAEFQADACAHAMGVPREKLKFI